MVYNFKVPCCNNQFLQFIFFVQNNNPDLVNQMIRAAYGNSAAKKAALAMRDSLYKYKPCTPQDAMLVDDEEEEDDDM